MTPRRRSPAVAVAVAAPEPEPMSDALARSEWSWRIGAVIILIVAAVLRLWDLPLKPFHNDEGVFGWFTTNLLRTGAWTYDPANYHGPTLYYFGLLSAILIGLNDVALRIVPAVFGLATIGLILAMRRFIGAVGSLAAALLLAVSPGWLYYSRFFIQEELFVCFSVALVYFAWRWAAERRSRFLMLASASLALMFATKETTIITVPVLLISAVALPVYAGWRPGSFEDRQVKPAGRRSRAAGVQSDGSLPAPTRRAAPRRASEPAPTLDERILAAIGRGELIVPIPMLGAAALFVAIYVTLFSSFFTNPKGVVDTFSSLSIWATTAGSTQTHPITEYAAWALQQELPIILLFLIGAFTAVLGARSRFAFFATLWASGLFAGYSLISYKEPWLMLNFLVPMAIVGGYGVQRLWEIWQGRRVLVIAMLSIAVLASSYAAIRLSFIDYDNGSNPYVYVQTDRDIYSLMSAVDAAGTKLGSPDPGITIMSPDYWPLPWYWRNHQHAGYFGQLAGTTEPIAIVRIDQEATLPADFTAAYARQGQYTLRPGVELVLYFRREAFGL